MTEPRSLRRSIRRGTAIAVGLALVALALSAWNLLRVLDARSDLNDRVDPAQLAAERHLTALLDQETGLRGYLATLDRRFLTPYQLGFEAEEAEADTIRELLGDDAGFEPVAAAAAAWHAEFADPVVDGDPATIDVAALLEQERVVFDRIRATTADFRAELAAQDRTTRDRLDDSTVQLVATLVAVVGLLAITGLTAWIVFRRDIERPLLDLGADADLISGGEIRHPINAVGPAEVAVLAEAMEAMRARVVEEVERVEAALVLVEEQAADLSRSNAELEQFAYVASHDLQEPLRKISSFCQLLQQRYGGQLDDRADQYIHYAVDGAKRMQTLINDLLAFSRVGRLSGELAPTELDAAVDRALDNLSTAIEDAEATIERPPLPEVVGDANLLAALFQNLVGNAIKFRRPDVPPVVRITATTADDELEVAVTDNGIGIDEEYTERIFVIFQRLHGRDAYEGTGIGLALCRKIVEHHGGRIWVDTSVTDGASVRFTLPLPVDPEPDDPEPEPESERAPEPEGTTP